MRGGYSCILPAGAGGKACRQPPSQSCPWECDGRRKTGDKHVDVSGTASPDAGSIPAASTIMF